MRRWVICVSLLGWFTAFFVWPYVFFRFVDETPIDPGLALSAQLEACGYTNHGISDVAWELYARGLIPLGSAIYYTNMVKSSNIEAAECMEQLLTGKEV